MRNALLVLLLLAATACDRTAPEPRPPASVSAPVSPSPSPSPEPPKNPVLSETGTFEEPIHLTSPPDDGRLFIVEKAGRIRVVEGGRPLDRPFLDIRNKVRNQGEQGMFMLAFAPNYARTGLAYVHYSDVSGDTRIVEYRVSTDPNVLDEASERQILYVKQPFSNHNGGPVLFGPDRMLYIALGDGGSGGDPGNRAQNLGDLLGKILRIDPSKPADGLPYGIPDDNPFVGTRGARGEVWAYGLRNPWRISFDPATRDLWIGDVGQNRFEEINWVPVQRQSGANYGWRAYEGTERFAGDRINETNLIFPVHTYSLSGSECAVTGGHVYRGAVNTLRNLYLFADVCVGVVHTGVLRDGKLEVTATSMKSERLVSFGEDSAGETYVVSQQGKVFKVVPEA